MKEIICNLCQSNKTPFILKICPIIDAKKRQVEIRKESGYMKYLIKQECKNYNLVASEKKVES